MAFNLVHSRDNAGNLLQFFQMMDLEIADTDGKYTPGLQKLSHFQPGACVTAGDGPVDQIKIQIVQLQSLQASVKCSVHISQTLGIVPDLACDKQLLAGNTAFGNGLAYTFFIFVSRCSVNKTISCINGCADGSFRFIICCLIYSKPQKRHFSVVIQEYGFSQS